MSRRKRTPEEIARKSKVRELMQELDINDMSDINALFKEFVGDILENGLRMMYQTANGGKAEKDNPSVKQLPAVNKQMLMLLKQMNISTDKAVKEGGDSGDDL